MNWIARFRSLLLPLGAILTFSGYIGPWIGHRAAGLVVTGLDLGEYVKFLPSIIGGQVVLWRPGFYLPLVAVSLAISFYVFDPRLHYGWITRSLLLAVAVVASLNMLPPAWTPQRMATAEFRWQAMAIVATLAAAAISPFLALIDRQVRGGIVAGLAVAGAWLSYSGFFRILDDVTLIYSQSQRPAWGAYVMLFGLVTLVLIGTSEFREQGNEARPSN